MAVTAPVDAIDAKKACLQQLKYLKQLGKAADPSTLSPDTHGTMKAIEQSLTVSGVAALDLTSMQAKPDVNTGSCSTVELTYNLRDCSDVACETNPYEACSDPFPGLSQPKTISVGLEAPICDGFTMTLDEFRCVCESPNDYYGRRLKDIYENMANKVNSRLITELRGRLGSYFTRQCDGPDSAADPITIPLFDTLGNPRPMNTFAFVNEYKKRGYGEYKPFMIGGSILDGYAYSRPLFQGNTNGMDSTKIPGITSFVDYDIDSTYGDGASHAISFIPGTVFPIEWFAFEDKRFNISTAKVARAVFDLGAPFGNPGFKVDQIIYVDECNNKVTYKFIKHINLFIIPDDAFNTECGQCGPGILHWLLACDDHAVCPK